MEGIFCLHMLLYLYNCASLLYMFIYLQHPNMRVKLKDAILCPVQDCMYYFTAPSKLSKHIETVHQSEPNLYQLLQEVNIKNYLIYSYFIQDPFNKTSINLKQDVVLLSKKIDIISLVGFCWVMNPQPPRRSLSSTESMFNPIIYSYWLFLSLISQAIWHSKQYKANA